jgi:hypothetical protein
MERGAEPAVAFSVPLKVDARAAHNWDEAHWYFRKPGSPCHNSKSQDGKQERSGIISGRIHHYNSVYSAQDQRAPRPWFWTRNLL